MLRSYTGCYIWRLRIPFENRDNPKNYISKLLNYSRLLEAHNSLTFVDEFVQACIHCWQWHLPFGTYNLTNTGGVLTSDVVRWIKEYGLTNKEFQFFADEREFMREAAVAPRSNCILNNRKALLAGLKLSPVDEAIQRCLATWTQSSADRHQLQVA